MKQVLVKPFWVFVTLFLFGIMFQGCTEEDPFYPIDPSSLAVTAIQANGTNIEDGRVGVKVDAEFTVIFSSPVDPAMALSSIRLSTNGEAANLAISFNDNQSIAAVTPVDSLVFESTYILSVEEGTLGSEGQDLSPGFQLNFTTEIEPKPLFASGTGTETDPYVIDSPEQFDLIRLFLDSYFLLASDIDLSAISAADPLGWAPLGDLIEGFSGEIDGAGFTVSGVVIARPDLTEVGLFGVLNGGLIKNLSVAVTGVEGAQATGALVGRQLSGRIENCHSSGSVTTTSSRGGGLVGSQEAGMIFRCSSSCGVFGTASRIGGLVGLSQAGNISESFATGNCESLSSRTGGLVGSLESDASVSDSYATGNVTGRNRAGGAIGRLDGTISQAYATGNVTVTDADESGDYPGHVAGQVGSTGSYSNIFYPNNQTINYSGGADISTDGTPLDISGFSCSSPEAIFSGFDFSSVWSCTADGNWPILTW